MRSETRDFRCPGNGQSTIPALIPEIDDDTDPYPVSRKFQIPELVQAFQAFDLRYLVLDEVYIRQVLEMADILDVLDLVEAKIQARKLPECFEAFDMRYQVVVEVQLL